MMAILNGVRQIPHCDFDLHPPTISDIEHLFMYPVAICMSLEKCLCSSCAHFWFGLFFFCRCWVVQAVCILWEINPLLVALFANIFFPAVGYLFILFMVFLVLQKLLSLIRSHLFLFLFLLPWETALRKLVWFMSEKTLPMFSSRSFMVSCLLFKSLNDSVLIFVYGIRICSNLIYLHGAVHLSQHHLLKTLFPSLYSYLLCQRLIDSRYVG